MKFYCYRLKICVKRLQYKTVLEYLLELTNHNFSEFEQRSAQNIDMLVVNNIEEFGDGKSDSIGFFHCLSDGPGDLTEGVLLNPNQLLQAIKDSISGRCKDEK